MAINKADYAIFKVNSISSKNDSIEFSETLHIGSVFDDLSIDDVIKPKIPIMTSKKVDSYL